VDVKDLEPLLVHAKGSGGDAGTALSDSFALACRQQHIPLDSPAIPQFTDDFNVYPGSFRCSRDQSPWFTFGYERAEIGLGLGAVAGGMFCGRNWAAWHAWHAWHASFGCGPCSAAYTGLAWARPGAVPWPMEGPDGGDAAVRHTFRRGTLLRA